MQISDREVLLTLKEMHKQFDFDTKYNKVELSVEKIEDIKKILEKLPEIRKSKVEHLNAEILSHGYKISSLEIAQKIIGRIITDHLAE